MFRIIFLIFGLSVNYVLSSVNNEPAALGEFPFHVSIQNLASGMHHCGGVIVDPYYVLTAAHCIDGFEPEDFQIVAGTIDLKDKKVVQNVTELLPAGNYSDNDSWINDIGLMKLRDPLIFNATINKAILPQSALDIPTGTNATVIGFGRSHPNGYTSKTLHKAVLPVKDLSLCNEKYKKAGKHFRNSQICAQSSNGAGICGGDSGGAFIVNGAVVGISSFTNQNCDHDTFPSVFTKVSEYTTWINENIMKDRKSKL